MTKARYMVRIPNKGYFVSSIAGTTKFTYDERAAWSVDCDNFGWKTANQVCEDYQRESGDTTSYVCERNVKF